MAKAGRKPVPTAVLKARGSWRGKVRDGEPEAPKGCPVAPAWLSAKGKTRWKRITDQLDGMGVLAQTDGEALARWCECCAEYDDARKLIKKHGLVYETTDRTGSKRLMSNPAVSQARQLEATLNKLEAQFGLTPVARVSLNPKKEQPKERGIKKFIPDAG